MSKEERRLVILAECGSDKESSEAIKKLREEYDSTYGFCMDCDGLVVKEKDCCLNR